MNPRANNVPSSVHPEAAFNLVEVAIALAIVAFALTAIFGVLPAGVNVQRDNRAETIINYDARYWMEAIRSGQMLKDYNPDGSVKYNPDGSVNWQSVSHDALKDHVQWVRVERPSGTNTFSYASEPDQSIWPALVIGRLSYPDSLTDVIPIDNVVKKFAKVRSLTGRMGDIAGRADAGFYYQLETSISPILLTPTSPTNLYQLRLTFRWPLRTGVAGDLLADDINNLQVDASGNLVNVRKDPFGNYVNVEKDPQNPASGILVPARVAGTGFKTFTTLVSGTLFGGYWDAAYPPIGAWVRQKPASVNEWSGRLHYFRPTMFEPLQ